MQTKHTRTHSLIHIHIYIYIYLCVSYLAARSLSLVSELHLKTFFGVYTLICICVCVNCANLVSLLVFVSKWQFLYVLVLYISACISRVKKGKSI